MLRIEIWNSFMFVYGSWHPECHLCYPDKLPNGEIQKWHISSKFVYPKLCNLTYGYEYLEGNFFKSLRTKWTFCVSECVGCKSKLIWCRENQLPLKRCNNNNLLLTSPPFPPFSVYCCSLLLLTSVVVASSPFSLRYNDP